MTTTIAILGACSQNGKIASRKLVLKNRLLLMDENKEALQQLKEELESMGPDTAVEIMECFENTGWEADAIVLAIQSATDRQIFSLMKPYVTGKKVIVFSADEKEMNEMISLLPYSRLIGINPADCECVNKMAALLQEAL